MPGRTAVLLLALLARALAADVTLFAAPDGVDGACDEAARCPLAYALATAELFAAQSVEVRLAGGAYVLSGDEVVPASVALLQGEGLAALAGGGGAVLAVNATAVSVANVSFAGFAAVSFAREDAAVALSDAALEATTVELLAGSSVALASVSFDDAEISAVGSVALRGADVSVAHGGLLRVDGGPLAVVDARLAGVAATNLTAPLVAVTDTDGGSVAVSLAGVEVDGADAELVLVEAYAPVAVNVSDASVARPAASLVIVDDADADAIDVRLAGVDVRGGAGGWLVELLEGGAATVTDCSVRGGGGGLVWAAAAGTAVTAERVAVADADRSAVQMDAGGEVWLSDVTLTAPEVDGAGALVLAGAGALALTVSRATVTDLVSRGDDGGLVSGGDAVADVRLSGVAVSGAACAGGGCALAALSGGSLTAVDVVVGGVVAGGDGGLVLFEGDAVVELRNVSVSGSEARNGGALAVSRDWTGLLLVDGCAFADTTTAAGAAGRGGVISLTSAAGSVTVRDSSATGAAAAGAGGFLAVESGAALSVALSNVTLDDCDGGEFGGGLYFSVCSPACSLTVEDSTFRGSVSEDGGGAMYVSAYVTASVRNSRLLDGASYAGGGVMLADDGDFTFANCTLAGNAASSAGGAIWAMSSTVALTDGCVLADNSATYLGGAVALEPRATLTADGATLARNEAQEGGALALIDGPTATLRDCEIVGNRADALGGALAAGSQSSLAVLDSRLAGNSAGDSGGAVVANSDPVVLLERCALEGNEAPNGGGGAVYALDSASVAVNASTLARNAAGGSGGALLADGGAELAVTGSAFADNRATYGGAVAALSGAVASLSDGSRLAGGEAVYGGALFAGGSASLTLVDSAAVANNASAGGALWCEGAAEVGVVRSALAGNDAQHTVSLSACAALAVETAVGGAVTAAGQCAVALTDATVANNTASEGGAVHTIECAALSTAGATRFEGNAAGDIGGALALESDVCAALGAETALAGNAAGTAGGAVYWADDALSSGGVDACAAALRDGPLYSGNTAGVYGADVAASFSRVEADEAVRVMDSTGVMPALRVHGVDYFGQDMTGVPATLFVGVYAETDAGSVSFSGQTLASGDSMAVEFSQLQMTAAIGSTFEVEIEPLQPAGGAAYVNVTFRSCASGSISSDTGDACVACERDTYAFQGETLCHACPTGAVCFGGDQIVPAAGYWRSGNTSAAFHACPVTASCLGPTASTDVPGAAPEGCAAGYTGVVCGSCAAGYERDYDGTCQACGNTSAGTHAALVSVAAVGIMVAAIVAVYHSLDAEESDVSAVIKIIGNFLLSSSLLAHYQLDWGSALSTLFNLVGVASGGGGASTLHFANCALGLDTHAKFAVLMATPLVVLVLPAVMLVVYYAVHRRRVPDAPLVLLWGQQLKRLYRHTLIVLFYFIYPQLLAVALWQLSCEAIEGRNYLRLDYSIDCDSSAHAPYRGFGVLYLALFGPGLPLLLFVCLWRIRARLQEPKIAAMFFFVYGEFKREHYYWEVVVLLRKAALACVSVLLDANRDGLQLYVGVWIMLFFVIVHFVAWPHRTAWLSSMEAASLCAVLISLLLGELFDLGVLSAAGTTALQTFLFVLNATIIVCFVVTLVRAVLRKAAVLAQRVKAARAAGSGLGSASVEMRSVTVSVPPSSSDLLQGPPSQQRSPLRGSAGGGGRGPPGSPGRGRGGGRRRPRGGGGGGRGRGGGRGGGGGGGGGRGRGRQPVEVQATTLL